MQADLKAGASDWRIWPTGSLGERGIPARPVRPYVMYGEGVSNRVPFTKDGRLTLGMYYTVYAYDDPGSYQRIKRIQKLVIPSILELAGSVSDDGIRITDVEFRGFGQDGYDPVNKQLVKTAQYYFVISEALN